MVIPSIEKAHTTESGSSCFIAAMAKIKPKINLQRPPIISDIATGIKRVFPLRYPRKTPEAQTKNIEGDTANIVKAEFLLLILSARVPEKSIRVNERSIPIKI